METPSCKTRIFRLVFGGLFTALGVWMTARVILQLEDVHAPWPDWLILVFPALPLSLGILTLLAAYRNFSYVRRPFLRQRTGAARVFGSVTAGFFLISTILRHLSRQTTLGGVMSELVVAAIAVGLSALIFGAIDADARDRGDAARE